MVFTVLIVLAQLVEHVLGHCPALTPPVNGALDLSCGTRVGTICRIYCRKNCQLVGDRVRRCLADHSWSGSTTYCVDKKIRCKRRLDPPDNGYQVGDCPQRVGCVCRFGCNTGYDLIGSPKVFCQRNGQWSPRPTCQMTTTTTTTTTTTMSSTTCEAPTDSGEDTQPYCPALNVPTNGVLIGSCGVSPPNSICRFTCNTGYKLIGNSVRICQKSGKWTDSDVSCVRGTKCPALKPPSNGLYFGYCSPGISGFKCKFACNSGYTLNGSSSLTCQSNGKWSSSSPVCVDN